MSGVLVDRIKVAQELLYGLQKEISDEMLMNTLRAWEATTYEHGGREFGTSLGESEAQSEAFARLIIGNVVRNYEDWVTCVPTPEHLQGILDFIHTGSKLPSGAQQTIWRMILNTTFFVTENGGIGLGSPDTEAGDEVWIFYGSHVPFTVRKREGEDNEVDRLFIGRCYVQGIMSGEVFMDEERVLEERLVRLH